MRYTKFCDDCLRPIMKKSVKANYDAIMRNEPPPEFDKPEQAVAILLVAQGSCHCED